MKLNIVHVICPQPPGQVGGSDLHVAELAAHQAGTGLRPLVIQGRSREYAKRIQDRGVRTVDTSDMGRMSAILHLARTIRHTEAEIVHAHGYDADVWAGAAHLLIPRPRRRHVLVMTQHGVVSNTFWLKAKTAVDARFIGLADGVIACSADLLPRMRAWCPRGKLVCIPNGVEQPSPLTALKAREVLRERFGARTSGALIGYVGRLSHEKRPDRLISLVARARATGRDVHGLIVGSGPLRSALEKQARALDVSEEITFTGMMQELNVVYGALDALVALSDTEATPRVVVEAMAASVPIVASTVGGLPDMLDHGRAGMLVPPDDERAWLAALVEALDDPGPRTDAARRLAEEQYSIATMGRRVETFYRELMAARGPL